MEAISELLKHKFIKDTFIMMVAMMLSNFFNYVYQLSMGRLLTPVEYGELFSLLSLLYIFSMFSMTINTSVTKFTATYRAKNEFGKIKTLLVKGTKKLALIGIGVYMIVAVSSPFIAGFLNINNTTPILLLFASIPFGFLLPLYQGALRGLQRFVPLGISLSSWSFFKLFFAIVLVLFGFGVLGGVSGVFLAHVAGLFVTAIFLVDIFKIESNGEEIELHALLNYTGMAFLAIFAYTTMWNVDVILVKHYLSPLEAGQYSAISVLGKIVLFAPAAVGVVLFPETAERYEKGEEHFDVLIKGFILTALVSGGIVITYALFPEFIIKFIYGEKYLSVAPYLWKYGLAMMFFALTSVIVNYSLSINKSGISVYLFVMLVAEILALSLYAKAINTIIDTLIAIGSFLTMLLFVYIWRQQHA